MKKYFDKEINKQIDLHQLKSQIKILRNGKISPFNEWLL